MAFAQTDNLLSPYRKFLVELSSYISGNDLETLKFAVVDLIPRRKTEEKYAYSYRLNTKMRLTKLCLSGFELYYCYILFGCSCGVQAGRSRIKIAG